MSREVCVPNELKLIMSCCLSCSLTAGVALLSVSSQNNDWFLGGHETVPGRAGQLHIGRTT